jgi:glycosyltransferase involved in cell wall biosynthesis
MVALRLAIIASHPIQYQASVFRALASRVEVDLEVFFCHKATAKEQAAAGFGIEFDWDVSLLDGYRYRFLKNVAASPTVSTFAGVDTPEIKELIQQESFDAVMVNGWHYKSAWQAIRSCWRTKTPVMVRSDSHLHSDRSSVKRVAKWPLYRWFIPKLDACLPVGKWSRDYFLHYGARADRLFVVPHSVDTDYFSRESERLLPRRTELRRKWKLAEESVVFVFAGKFIEKKRPLDFVRAISESLGRGADVSGLMVGDGPLRKDCEELAGANKLPIRFAGFLNQSQIIAAYVAGDALILPSDGGETWGLVVNEAMACGRPCFLSDRVGAGPDMIITDQTGAVFPLGDTKALADLLVSLASDSRRLTLMGQQVKQMAKLYSVDAAVNSLVKAVNQTARIKG